jgi:hypothetical protein
MTVKEYIGILQTMPQDAEVFHYDEEWGYAKAETPKLVELFDYICHVQPNGIFGNMEPYMIKHTAVELGSDETSDPNYEIRKQYKVVALK